MHTRQIITPDDLHDEDFDIEVGRDGKKRVRVVVTRREYLVTMQRGYKVWSNNDADLRKKVVIQNGYGQIHLDFKRTTGPASGIIAKLPDTCPTPQTLIETQLHDGSTVYVSANSRDVRSQGINANTRYIVDIVGYFNQN